MRTRAELEALLRARIPARSGDRLAFLDGVLSPGLPDRDHTPSPRSFPMGERDRWLWPGGDLPLRPFPARGVVPDFHNGLEFLDRRIDQACLCLLNESQAGWGCAWLGRDPMEARETWSASKFVPALCALAHIAESQPAADLRGAFLAGPEREGRWDWQTLLTDIVDYRGGDDDSNEKASTLKSFFSQADLLEFIQAQCGPQPGLQFGRNYGGFAGLLERPTLRDARGRELLGVPRAPARSGENLLNGYVLTRLLMQLALHDRLAPEQQLRGLVGAETVLTALTHDPAVYLEAALETLELPAQQLRVVSKMGMGPGRAEHLHQLTYVVFCEFLFHGKPVRFGLFLRAGESHSEGPLQRRLQELDLLLATEVALLVQHVVRA